MSKSSAETTTAINQETITTRPAKTRKTKPVNIREQLPRSWQKEKEQRRQDILGFTSDLWEAKAKLDKANSEYESALYIQKYYQKIAINLCVDVILERLPEAERRFLISEIVSMYRLCSDGRDIVIPRRIIREFIESLVYRYM